MTIRRFGNSNLWVSAPRAKVIGQVTVSIAFAVLAVSFPDSDGQTPAAPGISLVRNADLISFVEWGQVGVLVAFALWATLIIVGTSNAVNLTDGLDGLASGSTILVFISYVVIRFGNSTSLVSACLLTKRTSINVTKCEIPWS